MKFYKDLHGIEKEVREKPPDGRRRLRTELAAPIFEKMKAWAENDLLKIAIKSKIGIAIRYFLNQYERLAAYLRDGRIEMNNGLPSAQSESSRSGETIAVRRYWLTSSA